MAIMTLGFIAAGELACGASTILGMILGSIHGTMVPMWVGIILGSTATVVGVGLTMVAGTDGHGTILIGVVDTSVSMVVTHVD